MVPAPKKYTNCILFITGQYDYGSYYLSFFYFSVFSKSSVINMYYFVIEEKKVKKIQMPGIFLSSIYFACKSENVFISIYE